NKNDDQEHSADTPKKKGGMRILAIDTTKSVLIYLTLDSNKFKTSKCKKKRITLGVNHVSLHKLIKTMAKDDNMSLYVDHDDINYLKIKIDNPEVNKDTIFKLKLLDLKEEKLSIPDITFDAVITMDSSVFHRICREMNQ